MENDTDVGMTLEELNDIEFQKLIAPIIYLVILLVVGIPGNLSVLIIYRNRYSKSVYRTIIWNLALTDFSFCLLALPFNIGRLIMYYTFTELYLCKFGTTIITIFIMFSSHLLVILSIHRYRQVCTPLQKQIAPQNIKYLIIGGLVLAVFLNIPQFILQPLDHVSLENNITGYVCAVSFNVTLFADFYNGAMTFLFTFYAVVLFVLYILIGRRMYIQRKLKHYSRAAISSSEEVSHKITKIAVTVSVVFAFSYIPLYVLKLLADVIEQETLSTGTFGLLKIMERSYAINHVANPFIYAFYDNRFRRELKLIFMPTERRQQMEGTSEERTASKDRTLETLDTKTAESSESKL